MNNIDDDIAEIEESALADESCPSPGMFKACLRLLGGLLKDVRRIADAQDAKAAAFQSIADDHK